jgi:uncharacterized repeat protein (TIGR03837 family)
MTSAIKSSMTCPIASPSRQLRWDIFCRVIDNYGDAGVCWRLASDLAQRGGSVRLYIDEPTVLAKLQGGDPIPQAIYVCPWPGPLQSIAASEVADVVIEAFACDLPDGYLEAMNGRHAKPVWINLEYLSAESWVETHHGLPSPHPRLNLKKYFFFPGFTSRTGGLLREPWMTAAIEGSSPIKSDPPQVGLHPCRILMFSYEPPVMQIWLDALVAFGHPVHLGVTPCPARRPISDWTARQQHNEVIHIESLPFVPQRMFDALLQDHDILFVRGEDSFVRAQWAGKPLVWQIYPQADRIHLDKLLAFYDRYLDPDVLNPEQRSAYRHVVLAWNGAAVPGTSLTEDWQTLIESYPQLHENALKWRHDLLKQQDLVSQLRDFVSHLVK